MARIAVVGATGTIGSRVASKLAAAGHEVLGVSRRSGQVPENVTSLQADLTDRSQADRMVASVDALYLTPPEAGEDPLALERSVSMQVIEAARDAGVAHVLMHTAVHADRGTTGARILDNKQPIEVALIESGVPYTILRPAWFFQNLFGAKSYLEQGMFSMPWPVDMVWAGTDVEDVARAAVSFLERGPAKRAFDVHVPGGVSAAAICAAVQRTTGQSVAYQEGRGTREAVDPYPISEPHKELFAELFDYFKRVEYLGDPLPITEAIDGFAYNSLDDFMQRELFATVGV